MREVRPPQLMVLSGLPGCGKSTLGEALARRLGVALFSVDPIEDAMLRAGLPRGFQTGLAAYVVAESLARRQLQLGQGVIIDAVNAVEEAKEMWRQLSLQVEAPLRVLQCVCSDGGAHRARLAARQRGLAMVPEPTWEQVQGRRVEFTRWREPVLMVDSMRSTAENVERVLEWLRA